MNNETYNPDISKVKNQNNANGNSSKKQPEDKQSFIEIVKQFGKKKRVRTLIGIIFAVFAFFLLLSFTSYFLGAGFNDQNIVTNNTVIENAKTPGEISNAGAAVGASVSDNLIAGGVGFAAFIFVIWGGVIAWRLLSGKRTHFFTYSLLSLFSVFAFSVIIGAATYNVNFAFFHLGGDFGHYVNKWLLGLVGLYGMIAVNFVILVLWIMLCYDRLKSIYKSTKEHIKLPQRFNGEEIKPGDQDYGSSSFLGDAKAKSEPFQHKRQPDMQPTADQGAKRPKQPRQPKKPAQTDQPAAGEAATMADIETSTALTNPNDPTGEFIHYKFPPLELLDNRVMRSDSVDIEEQESNKQRIRETLMNYGISIKTIDVHVGPTVTLFEIVPEDGVKIAKIKNLEDDIALSIAAIGIRIIAPMPGRGTIGIEVANRDPQVVPMRQVLASKTFQESKAKLPMCLGCTVTNEVFVADLTKMPHLLVAGATGKGKSVGLNAIIASLLYKKGPSELKFVLVDPKRVEFSVYSDIEKYFFAKVEGEDRAIITQTDKVVKTLNSLVQEMENRYEILEDIKERTIEEYNQKWRRELREVRDEHGDLKYKFMPYIVAIIDEFSDMIMTAGKEVEAPIVRIAQKARAVGIHMIIATQRPSAQVITGLIKSNFPGRVAFAVSSMTDSRIIIDASGAQRLIGRGDMLFQVNGENTRLQCPLIDTHEIVKICDYIYEQECNDKNVAHEEPFYLPEFMGESDGGGAGASGGGGAGGDRDPLFEDAVRLIVQSDYASTSSLQRRYNIGYNRAGRIMDQMEAAGIVGPSQGGKPRKVLMSPLEVDQMFS